MSFTYTHTAFFILSLSLFLNFWLCWIFAAVHGLSLVAESRGYSLVAVHRLLTAVTSALTSQSTGSRVHVLQQLWLLGCRTQAQ